MKSIIYQALLWILLLIIPVTGQENGERELAMEKVYAFKRNEKIRSISFYGKSKGQVQDAVTVAKIDAFVASMKTDAEKIASMTLLRVGYGHGYTTKEHTERVVKKFLSDNESLRVRAEAVDIAADRGLKNLEPEMLNVFKEAGHTTRAREKMIRSLSWLAGVDSLIEIRPYLDSEDKELRTAALEAFARMAPRMTLDRNLALLTHVDAHERKAAVERLAKNGESLAHALHAMLDDPESRVRGEAVEVLGDISHKEYLMDLLFKKLEKMGNDDSVSVRSRVLSVITKKFKDKSNPFIIEALKDENKYIIEDALGYLRSSTIPHEKQIELITPFLKHPEEKVRLEAVSALHFPVARLQNDGLIEDASHKKHLLNALFEKLEKMHNDDSVAVRRQVLSIIARQFKDKSDPFILEALKEEDRSIIRGALPHLSASTIPDEKKIELIMPFFKHPAHDVRYEALIALGRISDEESLTDSLFEELEKLSNDDVHSVRKEALSEITRKFKDKSHPFILDALRDKSEYVIERALSCLLYSTIADEKKVELTTPFMKHPNRSISELAKKNIELLQKKQAATK